MEYDAAGFSGSPPLARELQLRPAVMIPGYRITPAHAGITRVYAMCLEQHEDHPRSRGNYILHKMRHSKEMFDQINEDIDAYRKYCDKHPEYKNNKAVMAIGNIEKVYGMCLEQHDFLE